MVDSKLTLVIEARVRDEVTRQMRAMGRETEQAGKKSAAAWKAVGTAIAAIGASVAVSRALRFMRDLSVESIKVASDVEETRSAFRFVFEDLSREAEDFSESLARSLNRSSFRLQEAMTSFQLLFEPLGIASDRALELSQRMVRLGIDLGSLFNKSPQEAFQRLQQGLAGSPEAAREIGIFASEMTLRQEALASGITQTNRQLTQQERALAFVELATRNASKAIGDAERTKGSFANRMVQLGDAIFDTKAEMGGDLINSINAAVEGYGGWDKAIKDVTASMEKLTPIMATFIDVALGAAAPTADFMEEVVNEWRRNVNLLKGLAGDFDDSTNALFGGGASARRTTLFDLTPEQLAALQSGGDRSSLPPDFRAAGDINSGRNVLGPGSANANPFLDQRMAARLREYQRIFAEWDSAAQKAAESTGDVAQSVGDVASAFGGGRHRHVDLGNPSTTGLGVVASPLGIGLTASIGVSIRALEQFNDTVRNNRLAFVADSLDFGFTNAFADFVTGASDAGEAWESFANSVLRDFATLGGNFLSRQIFGGIFGLPVPNPFGFAQGGTGSFGEPFPVKGYASAGPIMRGPHIAVMGEGQHDEAVVPLPNGRSIPVDMRGGGAGGQNVFVISSPLDSNSLIAAAQQNPEAFAALVMQEVQTNPQLRAVSSDIPTRYNS